MAEFILIKKCVSCGNEFDRRNIDEEEYHDTQIYAASVNEDTLNDTYTITINSCCYDCEEGDEED